MRARNVALSRPAGVRPLCLLLRAAGVIAALAASLFLRAQEPMRGDLLAHDPSTIVKCGSLYYVFSTGPGIRTKTSPDLVNWKAGPPVFTRAPGWTTNAVPGFKGYFWAPDVLLVSGRYYLYYSVSTFGSQVSAIGLATNPTLDATASNYAWTDQGIVIQSTNGLPYNTIDPAVTLDPNGGLWMVFGSYWTGIKLVQLYGPTGKRISSGSPVYSLAYHPAIEAASLLRHGDYYYLFVNWDRCCAGVDSTYSIRVGRSRAITGPYLDRRGTNMMSDAGTPFYEGTGRFLGPGHAAFLNDQGTLWCSYHYYDAHDAGTAKLGRGRVTWTAEGWPALTNDWSAFYPFESGARDNAGEFSGTLRNGAATVDEPGRGRVLSLGGDQQYASLPLSLANANTFALWVRWNGGSAWQRIFDFGAGMNRYLYLTPKAGTSGRLRFAITPDLGRFPEQVIDAPRALPVGAWTHLAVTLDGAQGLGLLYVNGQPVATNQNLTFRPWEVLGRSNYVGRSQWPDPYFNGRIDSFRIYGRTLGAGEVAQLAQAHPSLAHRWSFTGTTADSIGTAHGVAAGSRAGVQPGAPVENERLVLDGSSGAFLSLPGGLATRAAAITVEFWADFGTNSPWARVFDFGGVSGSQGRQFLMFSPHASNASHQFSLSTDAGTVNLDGHGVLDGRRVHVACVCDPSSGFMGIYTNGVLECSTSQATLSLSGVSPELAYIGRSLFAADPGLNASIDELRLYHAALTSKEVAASYAAGPDALALAVQVEAARAPGGVTLSWPAYALGFFAETCFDLGDGGAWSRLQEQAVLSNGAFRLVLSSARPRQFVRLRRSAAGWPGALETP